MRFFTIHERPGKTGGDTDLLAVKTGFSWWAAVVPPLWLLWHRLWLGLIAYILFSTVFGVVLELADMADPAATAIGLALSFLIGVSAHDFRRWTLARHGWRQTGVLRAGNAEDAELLYRRAGRAAMAPAAALVRPMHGSAQTTVQTAAQTPMHGPADAFPRLLS